ncbi:MAG: hypothetical protein FJY10_05835 [Bacteroidetes bacterium]|nr:hypothetical protein [Bacteroidota bacterium]
MKINTVILVILFECIFFYSFGQGWPRFYGTNANFSSVVESYDKGILLGGDTSGYGSLTWGWLVKTDVNGEILWHIYIGDGYPFCNIWAIDLCQDGAVILTGATKELDT